MSTVIKCNANWGSLAYSGVTFFSYIDDSTFVCSRIYYDKEFFQNAKDKVDAFFSNFYLQP